MIRRGMIFPVSVVNFLRRSGFLKFSLLIGISSRRRGMPAIGFAKSDETFFIFRLHAGREVVAGGRSAEFAVEGAAPEKGIEFDLFEATRSAQTFLVACRNVARWRFAFGAGLGAFEDDDFAGHDRMVDKSVRGGGGGLSFALLLVAFIIIGAETEERANRERGAHSRRDFPFPTGPDIRPCSAQTGWLRAGLAGFAFPLIWQTP